VTIKVELVKEFIGRFTHTVDLFAPDLSSSIHVETSRYKGEIEEVSEILRQT